MAPDGGDLGRYSLSMWWSTGGGGDCRRKSWYSISVDTYIILWGGAAPLRTEQLLKLLQPFLRTDNEKIHVSASQKWSAHPFVSPIRMAWKPDNNREL